MAFVPFTKDDQPTMEAFNEKFQQAIDEAVSRGVKIEVGSYVGTGTSSATITLGYKPDFLAVFYKGRSGSNEQYHGFALPDFPWATSNVTMLAITETGFTVSYNFTNGSLSYLNKSGVTYGYIAFRKG